MTSGSIDDKRSADIAAISKRAFWSDVLCRLKKLEDYYSDSSDFHMLVMSVENEILDKVRDFETMLRGAPLRIVPTDTDSELRHKVLRFLSDLEHIKHSDHETAVVSELQDRISILETQKLGITNHTGGILDFYSYFNEARQLADSINDWEETQFSWQKAYVAAVFSAVAYEEIPQFELKKAKRAKIIPCDRYQAHISRWETNQHRASLQQLDMNVQIEAIVRSRVVITISKLPKVIFVSFRGTTLSFADFKADLDVRMVRYPSFFGKSARLHRGFFDAVLECIDEVVERLRAMNRDPHVPVYVTGHSLGGAMAAIFFARLDEENFHPFRHSRRYRTPPAIACYTFGMPRYGDTSAKSLLPQPYHIFNELDAIPTLPPKLLGFADSANERCLNAIPDVITVLSKGDFALRSGKGIATVLGVSDHRMERYVERTNAMRQK